MRRSALAAAAALAGLASACGGGSSGAPVARTPPDLASFLRLPVATPSTCPSDVNGTTIDRRSPWAGHVDLSVFISPGASRLAVARIRQTIRRSNDAQTLYYESAAQAYAEFQRLYTCWADVPKSQTPASLRVVLKPTATIGQRNDLVAKMLRTPAVDTVSCDPALPCTTLVDSASAAPSH